MAERCALLRITGRVQGVGYRAWAIEMAGRLGVRGWVRNRLDSTVEMLVVGDADGVAAMATACRDGAAAARVDDITIDDAEDDGSIGFRSRATA